VPTAAKAAKEAAKEAKEERGVPNARYNLPMRLVLATAVAALAAAAALAPAACGKPSCVLDTECGSGFVCTEEPGASTRTCTQACAADLGCPAGFACVERTDGVFEGICLTLTGDRAVGEACIRDTECASGACNRGDTRSVCVETCNLLLPCEDPEERCTLDGVRYICAVPLDDRLAGETCTDPRQCASGTCVRPPGDEPAICADNCSASVACSDSELVCVRLEGGARACLAPLEDGAACLSSETCDGGFCIEDVDGTARCASACLRGGCEDGFACVKDAERNEVCMPLLDDRASGEACSGARDCRSGHCARFVTNERDFGTLCADPCDEGQCEGGLVCWENPVGPDVCGPQP
jgi:hypothetical protein